MIFGTELIRVADEIRRLYAALDYDHRPFIVNAQEPDRDIKEHEAFRRGYACLKMAVAAAIKPRSICEIGVGGGIAARAFLEGAPDAEYTGIDNGEMGRLTGQPDLQARVGAMLRDSAPNGAGRPVRMETVDSLRLGRLPAPHTFDLIHVDGNHTFEYAAHDFTLAWESGSKWILVDDARDSQVVAAVFHVLFQLHPGSTSWTYFEDTWTGNLLFCRELDRRP